MACTTGSDYTKPELTRRLCRAAPPSPRDFAATVKWAQLGDEAVVPPHECGSVATYAPVRRRDSMQWAMGDGRSAAGGADGGAMIVV